MKTIISREPGMKIKQWTITDKRMREFCACEDRDVKVAELVKKMVTEPRDEVERWVIVQLAKLYQEEIADEAPDSECMTLPDGNCIADNCKLHGRRTNEIT